MAFMIYIRNNGKLNYTGQSFSLAGYNLIYRLWEKCGRPTDAGWHLEADELIREHTDGKESIKTNALLIDFHPNASNRVGIIELLDVYAYTYSGATKANVSWTPMMLRLRDVLYEEYDAPITYAEKEQRISSLSDPDNKDDFVEFLYLNGQDKGWNWGRNGMTNAAFIHGPAREYFRRYF